MSKFRSTLYLLLALSFLPAALIAQGHHEHDSGQYVILSAQYGDERRHVDVTERLKQLARADRPIQVSNSTFGTDPDRGVLKALRIYARGPNGREQMFEYTEGTYVDGAQFRSWGRGEWGTGGWSGNWQGEGERDHGRQDAREPEDRGQYVILSAQYGDERRHVDVTSRLRELARADRLIKVSNATFGVDPDRGVLKVLHIFVRNLNGREQMFEYREGSLVDGSQFRGWGRGDWGNGGWSGNWRGDQRR